MRAKADAEAAKTAPAAGPVIAGGALSGAPSEESKRSSQQHYLSGVIFFQKGDYDKARDEWNLAKQLDPGNSDPQTGLERIEKLYGGGQ